MSWFPVTSIRNRNHDFQWTLQPYPFSVVPRYIKYHSAMNYSLTLSWVALAEGRFVLWIRITENSRLATIFASRCHSSPSPLDHCDTTLSIQLRIKAKVGEHDLDYKEQFCNFSPFLIFLLKCSSSFIRYNSFKWF